MSAFLLLDAATANGRGDVAQIVNGGDRRVYPLEGIAFGGAAVSIDVRSRGDADWKPTGETFSADTDAPRVITFQPGDEVSANRSGSAGAAVSILLA